MQEQSSIVFKHLKRESVFRRGPIILTAPGNSLNLKIADKTASEHEKKARNILFLELRSKV